MQNFSFSEQNYENALISLFKDKLGYNYIYGYDLIRDIKEPLLIDNLKNCLKYINANLTYDAVNEAVLKIKALSGRNLLIDNEKFTDYLQNGVSITYTEKGLQKNAIVKLIDYENINKNEFLAVNQYTVDENAVKRPDMVIFVNGLPLVDIELKSCSREETDSSEAYRQIRNRLSDIPSFYIYNAFCVISDMVCSKAAQ